MLSTTEIGLKAGLRLRECFRQRQAEVVSNTRNKIHQTWGPPFSRALYTFYTELEKVLVNGWEEYAQFPCLTSLPDPAWPCLSDVYCKKRAAIAMVTAR